MPVHYPYGRESSIEAGQPIPLLVESLEVRRWRRWGKDLLYVNDSAGELVARVNLSTGETTIKRPELEGAFHQAVAEYEAKSHTTVLHPEVGGVREPAWVDLAANRPGEGVRAKADEELALMKERSRFWTLLARTLDTKTEERGWRVGADGEETVGSRLDRLKADGWHVLHSVKVGARGCDIDHVLIGPGGVFTVNTKNHRTANVWVAGRTLMVNGHKTDYLRKSHFEAERAHRLLVAAVDFAVQVRPVLVIRCRNFHVKRQPKDVMVLSLMDVPRQFKDIAAVWSSEQIEAVFELARRSTTWSPRVR